MDITKFPAQRMWPLDGGMYLGTADAVITQDPESGRVNVGTYRMMIKGPREIGVYTSPGKDGGSDRDKWWKMGKPAPIAACYGIDPLLFLVGATSLPKTESEYEYYSGIKGSPIELFTSDLTGLPLPDSSWHIFVRQQPGESYAPIRDQLRNLAAIGLVMLGLLWAMGRYVASRIAQPIQILHAGVDAISQGTFDRPLNIQTGDEFEELAAAVRRMAERLKSSRAWTLERWISIVGI